LHKILKLAKLQYFKKTGALTETHSEPCWNIRCVL